LNDEIDELTEKLALYNNTTVDLGGGMEVPLSELLDDED
jgi:hypothetical protein